jgi:uncharacterized protein (TIGR03067 family)
MGARIGMVLACGLALAVNLAAEEKSDQDKLQGKWKIESGMQGGKPLPDDVVKTGIIEFDGNKIKSTVKVDGADRTDEMTFKLDSTKKPKAIDVDMKGKPGLGIYKLDGDTLTICHGEDGDPRPTEFESKEGTKTVVVVMKRSK